MPRRSRSRDAKGLDLVKNVNRTSVLDFVRYHSPVSRSEIAQNLDLSLPTVTRIVDRLMAEDLVRSTGQVEATGGRPRRLIEFRGDAQTVMGLDLGGSEMIAAVLDLGGRVQAEERVRQDTGDPDRALDQVCLLIERLLEADHPKGQTLRGIGIGTPGVVLRPDGIVETAASYGWHDLPLQSILSERFDLPVFVENDANLAALGEWGFGAGKNASSLVCLTVGIGIGAGIILNGSLYRGHRQAAGEVGHLMPGTDAFAQPHQHFGALESVASSTGVLDRAAEYLESQGRLIDKGLTTDDVFESARAGESWARQIVSETADHIALAIVDLTSVLDPEVIVLRGAVLRFTDLMLDVVMTRVLSAVHHVPQIKVSTLGYRSAALGALILVQNETSERYVVRRVSW